MKRSLILLFAAAAFLGCTEKPPADGDVSTEPEAVSADGSVEKAAAAAKAAEAEPEAEARTQQTIRRSEPGIQMKEAFVTVSARSVSDVFESIMGVAEAVRPGTGIIGRMAVFGGMGVPPDLMTRLGKDRPARIFVMDQKGELGTVACVLGDAGADSLEYLSGIIAEKIGIQPERDGDSLVISLGEDAVVITHSAPWLVIGDAAEGVKAVVGQLNAGAEPTLPDGDDHIAVKLDLGALKKAYDEEIGESLEMLKAVTATMEAQTPIGPKIIEEYVRAIKAAFETIDTIEASFSFTRESIDMRTRLVPLPGSALEPMGRSTKRCAWKVGRALPSKAMMTCVLRPDQETTAPILDAIAGAIARVAGSDDPSPEDIAGYRDFMDMAFHIGENAFSLNADDQIRFVMCVEADIQKMRSMYKQILPKMNETFGALLGTMGLAIKYDYKEDARTLEGQSVDRLETTYSAVTDEARQQLALVQQMWGPKQVLEITSCDVGTIGVMGSDDPALLRDAMQTVKDAGEVDRFGWPSASPDLRDALQFAPEATWMAGEVRLGAYIAFALSAATQTQPMIAMMFSDVDKMNNKESDPPLVFWVGSDDGDIVAFESIPTAAIANMVKYFEGASKRMQGGGAEPAPPLPGNGDGDAEPDLF